MINYTTPSISLDIEGADLSNLDVYVTLEQEDTKLTKSGNDLVIVVTPETEESTVTLVLTQEESALFDYNKSVNVQVNFINETGVRDATEIKKIPVMRNLLDEVISYGD